MKTKIDCLIEVLDIAKEHIIRDLKMRLETDQDLNEYEIKYFINDAANTLKERNSYDESIIDEIKEYLLNS